MSRRCLIVFAKEPRVGRVKRRLAAGIGPVAATWWYRRTLTGTLRRLMGSGRWRRVLAVAPDPSVHRYPWLRGWRVTGQGAGDLGTRMQNALHQAGTRGLRRPTGPAVLVGSDIPAVRPHHIERAFRALEAGAEVVLGPAADGGFWLIGVKRRRALTLFRQVRWSTEHALADSRAGLPKGVRVTLVDQLADVDDVQDLDKVNLTKSAD